MWPVIPTGCSGKGRSAPASQAVSGIAACLLAFRTAKGEKPGDGTRQPMLSSLNQRGSA